MHNFSSYHPASSLTAGSLAEAKRPEEIGAAVSKNPWIKEAPESFLKAATCPHALLGKAGVTMDPVFEESVLVPSHHTPGQ